MTDTMIEITGLKKEYNFMIHPAAGVGEVFSLREKIQPAVYP